MVLKPLIFDKSRLPVFVIQCAGFALPLLQYCNFTVGPVAVRNWWVAVTAYSLLQQVLSLTLDVGV